MAIIDQYYNDYDYLNSEIVTGTRLRVWLGLFYPESTRDNWYELLQDAAVPCAISPLHDQDTWRHDGVSASGQVHKAGDLKKPHYHVVFQFSGPKGYDQVYSILKMIALDSNHCPRPEVPRGDIKRAVQYLIHYNDKDKVKYNRNEITSCAGFDVERHFRLNSEQEDEIYCMIMDFVKNNNISNYWTLLCALRNGRLDLSEIDEMFRYARSHTMSINILMNAKKSTEKSEKKDDC